VDLFRSVQGLDTISSRVDHVVHYNLYVKCLSAVFCIWVYCGINCCISHLAVTCNYVNDSMKRSLKQQPLKNSPLKHAADLTRRAESKPKGSWPRAS
jgi:hypothetical protein